MASSLCPTTVITDLPRYSRQRQEYPTLWYGLMWFKPCPLLRLLWPDSGRDQRNHTESTHGAANVRCISSRLSKVREFLFREPADDINPLFVEISSIWMSARYFYDYGLEPLIELLRLEKVHHSSYYIRAQAASKLSLLQAAKRHTGEKQYHYLAVYWRKKL